MLLNNQWITEEIKEENVKYQEKSENENITIKINLRTAKSVQEEMYSNTNLPQETNKKCQISNIILYLKELEKEQTNPKLVKGKRS